VIVVATEFGRTARINGTDGTITAPAPSLCWRRRQSRVARDSELAGPESRESL